jgi:hypothetical protein
MSFVNIFVVVKVFLKEHSRSLYGPITHWFFGSLHYMFLRCSLGVMMGSIASTMLGLRKRTS